MKSTTVYGSVMASVLCFFSFMSSLSAEALSRNSLEEILTKASLEEASEKYEQSLESILKALNMLGSEMDEKSLETHHKAIDLLWLTGKNQQAISLCDKLINSIASPQEKQKQGLGLAVWKKSLIESRKTQAFSKEDKAKAFKTLNLAVASKFKPCETKKAKSE